MNVIFVRRVGDHTEETCRVDEAWNWTGNLVVINNIKREAERLKITNVRRLVDVFGKGDMAFCYIEK